MSPVVYKVPTKEISKLVLFVIIMYRTTGGPFDWQHFRLFCNLQKAQLCFVFFGTSNVTDRHRGPITERRHDISVLCAVTHIFAYWTSPVSITHVILFHRRVWYRAIFLRYVHAMRVFEVWASCLPLSYFLAKFRFCRTHHCWISPQKKMAYRIT